MKKTTANIDFSIAFPKYSFSSAIREKEGKVIRRSDFERMVDEYYALRGWDEQGVPKYEMKVFSDC